MHLFSLLSLLPVISAYLVSGSPTSASTLLPVDDTFSAYHCTDSQTWSGPSFFPRDCATALARFCVSELQVHEDVVFEFLAVGGRAQSGYASQETPRKYTYGTCTMAIAMLVAFFPEELPGVSPSRVFGLMDVATYNDVWNAVRRVMDNCISKYLATNETVLESEGGLNFRSQTGWSALGMLHLLKTFG